MSLRQRAVGTTSSGQRWGAPPSTGVWAWSVEVGAPPQEPEALLQAQLRAMDRARGRLRALGLPGQLRPLVELGGTEGLAALLRGPPPSPRLLRLLSGALELHLPPGLRPPAGLGHLSRLPPAAPTPEGQPLDQPVDPSRSPRRPAPGGLGAAELEGPGADGAGVAWADIEPAWRRQGDGRLWHPQLQDLQIASQSGEPPWQHGMHGTHVLGVVAAQPLSGGRGAAGMAPGARVLGLHSNHGPPLEEGGGLVSRSAQALYNAAAALPRGGVLLLEDQVVWEEPGGLTLAPAELGWGVAELIERCDQLGLTVICPAGNGGRDLNTLRGPDGRPALRSRSAAVLVAAGRLGPRGWVRHERSNHGRRIDFYADGAGVPTPSAWSVVAPQPMLRLNFSDTSAAAAIIAGAALIAQSLHMHHHGRPLMPQELRLLLGRGATLGAGPEAIGVMPNLPRVEGEIARRPR
jgi:Subtilase family